MYRVVSASLGILLAAAIVGAWLGWVGYTPEGVLGTAVVAILATTAASALGGALARERPHLESSVITGLLITFIVPPTLAIADLVGASVAGALAGMSKYALTWRGRHILNPAATGVSIASAFGLTAGFWWVANPPLTPLILVLGWWVAWRSGFGRVALAALAIGAGGLAVRLALAGEEFPVSLYFILTSYPIWFLALFMLTEPITMAPRRSAQLLVAAVVGLGTAFPLPVNLGFTTLTTSPELVLVLGNVVAWTSTLRRSGALASNARIERVERHGGRILGVTLELERPLEHLAGQWIELELAHPRADSRGVRRVFSISSAPDHARHGSLEISTTLADPGSSFKHELASATPGGPVRITRLGGDFVLPDHPKGPIVMVSGGIGVTPFISQIRDLEQRGLRADVSLIEVRRDNENYPFDGEIPEWVRHLVIGRDELARTLGGIAPSPGALWMVSGSPGFVRSARATLRSRGIRRVRTDVFTGY